MQQILTVPSTDLAGTGTRIGTETATETEIEVGIEAGMKSGTGIKVVGTGLGTSEISAGILMFIGNMIDMNTMTVIIDTKPNPVAHRVLVHAQVHVHVYPYPSPKQSQ
jgi:hypothetical protein